MASVLLLGLLIGMQHALEADHVAAVSSIAARQTTMRRIVAHGAVWGVGHTFTLMGFAGAAIVFGLAIGETLAGWLEFAVGGMLVGLGGHLMWRLWRDRVHFHGHRHGDGTWHVHAHAHRGERGRHAELPHEHAHPKGLPWRTLAVGMMHGMAGSAALLILTASTVKEPLLGLGYVSLFGLGSVVGMALLSAVIAVPLSWSARVLTWANRGLQGAIGAATAGLGLMVMAETAGGLGLF